MSSGKFEICHLLSLVDFLEDLCCQYFFSKLLKDQLLHVSEETRDIITVQVSVLLKFH